MKSRIALFCGLALAGANAMACYTVYDSHQRVIYRGLEAPVDMSLQLHEALAQRFPAGSQMQFNQSASCAPVALSQVARAPGADVAPNTIRLERSTRVAAAAPAKPSPLFTDRQTAEMSNLPHTTVAGDIVMVPASAADRAIRPTVTVLPDTTFVAGNAPDTRTLGAGGAAMAPDTRTLGAAAAGMPVQQGRRQVVITELRDPPVTIVQNGGNITITPQR